MEISSWLSLNSSFKLRMGENKTEANVWLFSSFSKTKKSRENVRKEIKLLLVTDQLDEKLTAFKFMFL